MNILTKSCENDDHMAERLPFQLTTECEAEPGEGAVAPEEVGEEPQEPPGDPAAKAIEQRSYRLQV